MKSILLSFLLVFAVGIFNSNAYTNKQIENSKNEIANFQRATTLANSKNFKPEVKLKSVDLAAVNKLDSIRLNDGSRKIFQYNKAGKIIDYKYWLDTDEIKEQQVIGYDASGNITSQSVLFLDDTEGFIEVTKEEYVYNSSNQVTKETFYEWDDDYTAMIPTTKNEMTYNSGKTTVYMYTWDEDSHKWQNDSYEVIVLDKQNRPTTADLYGYNQEKKQYELTYKLTWKYNADGEVTLITYSAYDEDFKVWIDMMRFESTYNASGNMTEEVEYFTVDEELLVWSRTVYSYNLSGNLIRKDEYDLNWFTGELANSSKTEWTYSGGKLESETDFELSYDGSGDLAENYKRVFFYSNTSVGTLINPEIISEYYEVSDILSNEKYQYGLVSKVDHYMFDYETMDLAQSRTATYYYSGEGTQSGNTDANLSDLLLDGETINNFDTGVFSYTISLLYNYETIPVVSATPSDANANISITQANDVPSSASIVVIAEDGVTQNIYYVHFVLESEPDASLSDLQVDGQTLSDFQSDETFYTIELSADYSGIPVVTATATDETSTIIVSPVENIPGSAYVEVTAADGETYMVYTIKFTVAGTAVSTLNEVSADGVMVDGFDPDITYYEITLPYGTTVIPEITYELTDGEATVEVENTETLPGESTITVTSADGFSTTTYIVYFAIAENNDASITGIQLDGVELTNVAADVTVYYVELSASTTNPPVVTATLSDENANVSIEQASSVPGSATIYVIAADGITTKTYIVKFTKKTGIDELSEIIKVYPNPFKDFISIDLDNERINRISITDLAGKIVLSQNANNESSITIETSNLKAGAYLICVQSDENSDLFMKMMKR